jgi:hypothetical protein
MVRPVAAWMSILIVLGCTSNVRAQQPPVFIPKDATASALCVPALGDVYWNPSKLPFGPTYGAYKGRPIFEEFMISQKDFGRGQNWQNIQVPIGGFKIDHVDIWFAQHGHPGAEQPHYDVILFYVPHAQHMKICNPLGALPSFVLQDRSH